MIKFKLIPHLFKESTVNKTLTSSDSTPKPNIVRRLYDWVLHWAQTPHGMLALFAIAFMESSFFPIPPDVLLIAMAVATPFRWRRIAFVCTAGSVLGAIGGYIIGYLAWDNIGVPVLETVAHVKFIENNGRMDLQLPSYLTNQYQDILGGKFLFDAYEKWNAWIVFIFALTPLPFKVVTITAGVAHVNTTVFVLASIFSRGLRFFLVAWIISKWGAAAKTFIDKYFNLLASLFVLILIGGFVMLKFLF